MPTHVCASSGSATSEAEPLSSAPALGLSRPERALRTALAHAALYLGAPAFGFLIFVLAFRIGAFRGVDILFYRGLVLMGFSAALTLAAATFLAGRLGFAGIRRRDAVSAAVLSLSLNLSFFVLSPVTIDRSVSVFILGEMAAHPGADYSADHMRSAFKDVYVDEYRQIERRMAEQEASGNVERIGGAYRITAQGRAFIRASGWIAWLFDTDRRLVDGRSSGEGGRPTPPGSAAPDGPARAE